MPIETPTDGRGGCSKMMTVSPAAGTRCWTAFRSKRTGGSSRRREFCRFAAAPSPFSRRCNRHGEGECHQHDSARRRSEGSRSRHRPRRCFTSTTQTLKGTQTAGCRKTLPFAQTLHLPCVSTDFAAQTLPLPCVSTAFAAQTLPFGPVLSTAFALCSPLPFAAIDTAFPCGLSSGTCSTWSTPRGTSTSPSRSLGP